MSHGCLYTSPNNSTGDFSAGSTNWLIERLVDGAPFDEIKGSLEAGIWGAEDITFAFTFPGRDTWQEVDAGDGNIARNVGVHGLTDPTGAMVRRSSLTADTSPWATRSTTPASSPASSCTSSRSTRRTATSSAVS